MAQFSLYVHKIGLKPDSFHFPRSFTSQQTREFAPALIQCWASVEDGGPT